VSRAFTDIDDFDAVLGQEVCQRGVLGFG